MAKIDDSVKKKVPELRFKGFTDEWEERKLSEIGKIVTGNTPNTSNKDYYNGDFLFVSPADIQENRYVNKTTTTLTELGFKTGRLVPKGATLFVSIGSTIGKTGQSICDVITNQQINSVISFSDYDDDFIYTSILNSSTKIKQLAATQAVPIINKNEFGKSIIKIPSLEEQQKIGAFFKQLDDIIALHQRKLDLLKETKKGFLQKMFPKNGAKVPEIRFPGFTEDWEERRLQEVVDRYDNLRIPITASKRVAGNTPYYGANGIQGYVEGYTHDGEFILVAEDGANDLKNYPVQYVDGKVWVNNHAHVIQAKENLADNMFLMNAIRSINIEPFLVGGGRAKLNADVLMKLEVIIPLKSEQQKIGNFFKQLDDIITLHQRKLDLLKETKKGFLQKMFV